MAGRLQENFQVSLDIIKLYKEILNAKVLNFFVENHWTSLLPTSWQGLEQIHLENLVFLLLDTSKTACTWPLSILALKVLLKTLTLSRSIRKCRESDAVPLPLAHKKLRPHFIKHLKPKKKHEIDIIGRHIESQATGSIHIVDFGAGLGHLCRHLAFGYGLSVCGIEMQSRLVDQATKIDEKMATAFKKFLPNEPRPIPPKYLNLKIDKATDARWLIDRLKSTFGHFGPKPFECGFVGLHPCGDLGVILMNIFLACPEIRFLSFAGCCYMKLTTSEVDFQGYPLSQFLRNIPNCRLSYDMFELACHAIEKYAGRLADGDYEGLKIHSYRAAIETIIAKCWPDLALSGLASVKYTADLDFKAYCAKAVAGLNIAIPDADIESQEIAKHLANWRQVVVFYTLRLMLAPLVESVVLADRLLYLSEHDCNCDIQAMFDPQLSPRNHIITAWKR